MAKLFTSCHHDTKARRKIKQYLCVFVTLWQIVLGSFPVNPGKEMGIRLFKMGNLKVEGG